MTPEPASPEPEAAEPPLSHVPGWYGKLPALGDFASRRLPPEFVQAWDVWLQDNLAASRAALGDAWIECYLTTPIWRFVLLAGVMGRCGWAGVLMPSVDRVGRHFPLTLATPLDSMTAAAHAVFDGGAWFAALEDAALTALDLSRNADDLDGVLALCAFVPPCPVESDGPGMGMRRLASAEEFDRVARVEALREWARRGPWTGLWWTRGRMDGHSLMLTTASLPTEEEFVQMLKSRGEGADTPGEEGLWLQKTP